MLKCPWCLSPTDHGSIMLTKDFNNNNSIFAYNFSGSYHLNQDITLSSAAQWRYKMISYKIQKYEI